MQLCTSLQTDNHASTTPLSFLQAGCPSCCPTNSVKALKEKQQQKTTKKNQVHMHHVYRLLLLQRKKNYNFTAIIYDNLR